MKIGLFGGTFDPIHYGHLRNAEEVREGFSLDRVLFIPASVPPHKKWLAVASGEDRQGMVRLAIDQNPGFELSDIELRRPGKSFSIDTIRSYEENLSKGDSLYFILGLDAFMDIAKWKDYEEIFRRSNLIVTSRPGFGEWLTEEKIPVAVRNLFCYGIKEKGFRHESGHYVYPYRLTDMAVSASEIRERLKEGRSIRYLVPAAVESYIEKRALYRG